MYKNIYLPNKYFNINKKKKNIVSNSMYVKNGGQKIIENVTKNMKKWEINKRKK